MKRGWHLIGEYKAQADTILCICGWLGRTGAPWTQHRKDTIDEPMPEGFDYKDVVYSPGKYAAVLRVKDD